MKNKLITLSLSFLSLHSAAQVISKEEIREVYSNILNKNVVQYKYTLDISYPNSNKEKLEGFAYNNKVQHFSMNTSKSHAYIYSKDWYIKANHVNKTVAVINLHKRYSKEYKAGLEDELFNSKILGAYTDSFIMKHGYVANSKINADTVSVKMGFKDDIIIDYINLVYLKSDKKLLRYEMKISMPENDIQPGKKLSYIHEIKCTDFRYETDLEIEDIGQYFTINNGSVELKKYKNYKLYSKL